MHAILILGAAVWADRPSPTLLRRTQHAAALWHISPQSIVVPCGGTGLYPPSEAAAMRDILIADGVADDHIMPEDQSTTTLENIQYARSILRANNVTTVTIVTDSYHTRRAQMVAKHFGLSAQMSSPPTDANHIRPIIREACALPIYALRLRQLDRC